MTHTITLNLPDGRRATFEYPASDIIRQIITDIFTGKEYMPLPFLDATTIVDIGAHIGAAAMYFSAYNPKATVYALEPASEAFALLRKNVADFPAIHAFNIGAHDHDATAQLFLNSVNSVANSLTQNPMTSAETETITLRRISTWLAEQSIEHISLLKLDAEGVELAIIKDLLPMIDRIDAIAVEYHSERDRLELDQILSPRYSLFAATASHPHRGVLTFVAKSIIAEKTKYNEIDLRGE